MGEKSNLVFISRNREKDSEHHALHLFNNIIRPVKNAKFLGLEIDNLLSFKKHIDELQNKTTKRLNVLKVLARNNVKPECLLKLYKSYIRPLMEYGSAAFIATSATQLNRLTRIQNEATRISLHLPSYIRSNLLTEYSGIQPIKNRILSMNRILLEKMKKQNSHITELCTEKNDNFSQNLKSPIDILRE